MRFKEACMAAFNGARIRHTDWDEEGYMYWDDDRSLWLDEDGDSMAMCEDGEADTQWEIVGYQRSYSGPSGVNRPDTQREIVIKAKRVKSAVVVEVPAEFMGKTVQLSIRQVSDIPAGEVIKA